MAASLLARWSFRLTPPGRFWLVTSTCLLGLGIWKNVNLLALLGYFLLVALFLNVMLVGNGLSALRVRRRHVNPVFAGRPCPLEVSVGHGPRAAPGVRLEERGRDHELTWRATWLGGRTDQTFQGVVILPRRGRYERGPLWAVSGYPFGLAERRVLLAPAEPIYVLPPLGTFCRGGLRRQLRGDPTADRRRRSAHSAAQGEVHGLRGFRAGDSPRTIHWRTSARRGELMVREFEDTPGDSLLLVLDPALPTTPDAAERFEEAVSLTATLAREWCRGGAERLVLAVAGPEGTLLLDGIGGPAFVQRALEHLAMAVAGGDAAALVGRVAALPNTPAGVVVVTVGQGALSGRLARQLRRNVTTLDVTDEAIFDFYNPPAAAGEGQGRASRIVLHPLGS
jgi:uncharacterized protein (DUF58 family)